MSLRAILRIIPIISGLFVSAPALTQNFSGSFEFSWLDGPNGNHREMQLLKTVKFTSVSGKHWIVPKMSVIDGASIPRLLWTFAGSPFVGKYRRASVIHDHYCDIRTELQSEVHQMFKEAMIADGASWIEANSKYAAVVFAGLCPQKIGIKTSKLESFAQNNPNRIGPDIIGSLNAPINKSETMSNRFEKDKETIKRTLASKEVLIFETLLDLKDATTTENLALLESRLQQANLNEARFEDLVVLVDAIYPERFK